MNHNSRIHLKIVFSGAVFLLALASFFFPPSAEGVTRSPFIDNSHAIFFPEKLGETLESYKNFPVTWWNFLIFEMNETEKDWVEARIVCDHLKKSDLPSRIECRQDLKSYLPLLQDWARDVPLRRDRPSNADLLSAFGRTLAKASLPLDKSILSHLRNDPLESDRELKALAGRRLQFNLERKNGFLFHSLSHRILIPIQFHFPPDRDDLTSRFYEALNQHCLKEKTCSRWVLVGPHASTWENKKQIVKDVATASRAGMAVLAFFCICLVLMRRFKLIFIIPPVLVSVLLASVVTVWVFGSIHGLVLSFGAGLVGISYDYGAHSALSPPNLRIKSIWAANWFGYLTTVAVFGVLMFSQIPLLRQLMFFSTIGLTFSFLILLLLDRVAPQYARTEPLPWVPRVRKWKSAVVILVWLGLFFSWRIPLRLDLSSFDFQSPLQRASSSWLFKNVKTGIPLFEVHSTDEDHSLLKDLSKRIDWGDSHGIRVENAAEYLPQVDRQTTHLRTWMRSCNDPNFLRKLNDRQKQFFEPYLRTITCDALKPNPLETPPYPSYVSDFNSGHRWMTLWFPKNREEAEQIFSEFPQAASLRSLADSFPILLAKELAWMGPLSFVLVTFLLFLYFKDLKLTGIALIPFVTGLGLISWFHFISGLGFSFISLMALIMICGMSVDYGIFAADIYRYSWRPSRGKESLENQGVWTSLFMAVSTTVAGFLPLDFCRHPVLMDLGRTLTLGMIGTILGTFWGVPFALGRLNRKTPS